ncbi:carbon storage regulator CsrA [Treponema zuelzerae]|uniref:Translational regulator CsrA n=1 Tax=Teretinema zuelzerae TaxID=156 RepID=A0AAE3JK37_9SPIR|nr:carbon storage regulator CsrA [Teretinema zuelzerae]MCD1654880.1 carbon storage regulator CsrA [Teretinema zuelzerae]
MLILSRKINEKIMIGDDISVTIIEIRGDQVKIGVEAPKSVKVFRHEVFEAIKSENQAAAVSQPDLSGLSGILLDQ